MSHITHTDQVLHRKWTPGLKFKRQTHRAVWTARQNVRVALIKLSFPHAPTCRFFQRLLFLFRSRSAAAAAISFRLRWGSSSYISKLSLMNYSRVAPCSSLQWKAGRFLRGACFEVVGPKMRVQYTVQYRQYRRHNNNRVTRTRLYEVMSQYKHFTSVWRPPPPPLSVTSEKHCSNIIIRR